MAMSLNGTTGIVLPTAAAPAVSAYQNTPQAITANVWTKVLFQTEEFDTNNNFASSRFTPTVAGYYLIGTAVQVASTATYISLALYKNGTAFKFLGDFSTAIAGCSGSALIYFNGSTDYVETYVYIGVSQTLTASGQTNVWFNASMVRSA